MAKRLTLSEFIERSKKIFGERYDYSFVEYVNNSTKVKIYDKELSEFFFMTPASHLSGQDNPSRKKEKLREKNSMGKDKFIEKAVKKHGDKYDYSKVEYINNRTKVCIICPEHGEFWQTPDKHLIGEGCPKCCKQNRKYSTDEFIKQAKLIHGDKYDYAKTKYGKNKNEKVIITCREHGDFEITPSSHLNGSGCKYCTLGNIFSTEDFINKARLIHGERYSYYKSIYINAYTPITISCKIHGDFLQDSAHHINRKQGCPECAKLYRISETKLYEEIKKRINEEVIHSYKNKNILGKQELDIFIPKYNIGIEFQGEQHFKPIDFGGYGEQKSISLFNDNVNRDIKKKDACEKNGITILYFSETSNDNFLGEKIYHSYDELISVINKVIKKEDEK